jgi:Domain of Unknown Function (DUF1088)
MDTIKNKQGSPVELVMLLCSQEWQTSLQRHAGLVFVELVNEGRLMAQAAKDHMLRVAHEAEFILNKFRAEDTMKHAEFEAICAQISLNRKDEERTLARSLMAAGLRDQTVTERIVEKVIALLCTDKGAWATCQR